MVLALLFASTVINYVDRQALSVPLLSLRTDLHLSSADYGAITTAFMLAYTVSRACLGALIDRSARAGFAIAMLVWSIAAMLHATATTAWSLLAPRALLGLGEAGNWPAGAKAVAEWFPQPRRAFAMGCSTAARRSARSDRAAARWRRWRSTHGWRAAFLLTGVRGLAWLAAWLVFYRAPEGRGRHAAGRRATRRAAGSGTPSRRSRRAGSCGA